MCGLCIGHKGAPGGSVGPQWALWCSRPLQDGEGGGSNGLCFSGLSQYKWAVVHVAPHSVIPQVLRENVRRGGYHNKEGPVTQRAPSVHTVKNH